MTITEGMMTSETSEWTTPRDLFERCNKRWGPFTLDAAATPENALCKHFCAACDCAAQGFDHNYGHGITSFGMNGGEESWCDGDALKNLWRGRVWCNPPYGREIGKWLARAYEIITQYTSAERIVMLLPARTDTAWWHDYVTRASEIHFLRGRLKFGGGNGSKNSAPFPSAIVVFERPFE